MTDNQLYHGSDNPIPSIPTILWREIMRRNAYGTICVGKAISKPGARKMRDRLDSAYGACVHGIVEIMSDGTRRNAM